MAKKQRLTERIDLRLPPALPRAIEAAAERRFVSLSEYIRLSVVHQLERDGVEIWNTPAAAA
jgi:Arc/MetJ-type ribon-helix-helix transcriptional regulator